MQALVRTFCAVPCGEQLAQAVTRHLDELRAGPVGQLPVRWTRPETWHLTLQFLGEWSETRLESLKDDLPAAADMEPFALAPGALDGFPNLESPRVLFLQMADDGQTAQLANRVREIVGNCWSEGPQDTRAFHAHLTLGRVKVRLSRDEANLLQGIDLGALPSVFVEGFNLVASNLSQDGALYTELGFFPLRK